MIRYALRCDKGHDFESWFQSSSAFDSQSRRKLIACPYCESTKVEKSLMTPALKRSDRPKKASVASEPTPASEPSPASDAPAAREPAAAPAGANPFAVISPQERELRQALRELREHVTKTADYVGAKFPEEARKMHYGKIDHRSIYGEASLEEAKDLIDEGIEFHPLPILPDDRN